MLEEVLLRKTISQLNETFKSGRTRTLAWRKAQLQAILRLIEENEDTIFKSLLQDLGKHPVESYRDEIGVVSKAAKYALTHLKTWMVPKKGHIPLVFFPAKGEIIPEPFGKVLIFGSWNFPISLTLDPLIGAISAGNTVVLKPSEQSPACSSFLAETIPLYLDHSAVKVIEGGSDVADQLLQQKWDKIFFTGSARVGRIVMSAAAKNLTPVTLELGGKCPIILDSLSKFDTEVAVKRIVGGKWGPCGGQTCIAIDYVLVEHKYATALIEDLKKTIRKFYGEDMKNDIAKIVNKYHFERLKKLIQHPTVASSIVYGGSIDEINMSIEPTILLNPPLDAEIMTDEIFGPFLPIITLDNIHDSIEFVSSRPKPLAIYAFTKNEALKKSILTETSSGSVTFNDILVQFLCDGLPFGGVGQSGFGRYHGKFAFDTFSHEKAVLHRSFLLELEPRYPPWNDFKLEFIRLAYCLDYIGLALLMLGLKRRFKSTSHLN
ncbi:aldehyde dehydrogenase family 3 member F1 [Impatiens glandulifera]|uniref:aldehyde dehydrogenase family 3 member F1 n=1 Tax=Impatiens glandulifera TaxID=253017 RepID=UPI001FB1509E|nr:aldehyde dehydrogenase family 3 member F1 [Impatiens glandulifera]